MSKYIRKCSDRYNRRPVLQYSMKNELIREWETVGQIYRELGFDKSAILRCCKGKQKRSYWFVWKFKDDVESQESEVKNESEATNPSKTIQQNEGGGQEGN